MNKKYVQQLENALALDTAHGRSRLSCLIKCQELEDRLAIAIKKFKEIEDLEPLQERKRRTIAREALVLLGARPSSDL